MSAITFLDVVVFNPPGSGFDHADGGRWIVLEASSLDKTQKYTDGVDIMWERIYL